MIIPFYEINFYNSTTMIVLEKEKEVISDAYNLITTYSRTDRPPDSKQAE